VPKKLDDKSRRRSAAPLAHYRDKRDPARTNEPFGAEPMHSPLETFSGRFVVHQHAATRMHWDLRIEVGGVLKSFAIPRGPSLSVNEKRLAVHTEDHPIDYLEFEAVIPAGNYGAGSMILWDYGVVQYLENSAEQAIASGKIDFVLHGFKLRGRFALVETKQKGQPSTSWLLLKKPDAHASETRDIVEEEPQSVLSGLRVEELAALEQQQGLARDRVSRLLAEIQQLGAVEQALALSEITPMRSSESGGRLDDPECLYELKLDGVRMLAERRGEQVQLRYRTQRNATAAFPETVRALRALPVQRLILDGEMIAFDDRGAPSFQRLAERIHRSDARGIELKSRSTPAVFLVFDVLGVEDYDLRKLPLRQRKEILAKLLPSKGFLRVLDFIAGDGSALYAFCEQHALEGVVAKRADSPYVMGPQRSDHWSKIKRLQTDPFVVIGYTAVRGNKKSIGALELASYAEAKPARAKTGGTVAAGRGGSSAAQLITRGRVGSGLDNDSIERLKRAFASMGVERSPAQGELLPAPAGRSFVRPELVVRVSYAGFTDEGRLWHPVFVEIADEVAPESCRAAPGEDREASLLMAAEADSGEDEPRPSRVKITNAKKVFWPDEGITKGDLCNFYGTIADTLLPYLRDRPVLMVRYPDGITGKNFYQWNVPVGIPSWVSTEQRYSEEDKRDVTFFRVEDRDTLLLMANYGCIPLHILAGRFADIERCDFLTIDFDLGQAPFAHAVTLARSLHEILDELQLPSFPKTSGQTGLHVLVPMGGAPFTAAVAMANILGRLLHDRHPDLSTLERLRRNRPKAVYIDTGQTGRSRAIVAPYSVRAHPGATVSTPLTWDEIGHGLAPERHTIFSVPERLTSHGDPMRTLLAETPDLERAMQRIEQRVARGKK
jgi:bifunctional non-homologous end joining protein LigD